MVNFVMDIVFIVVFIQVIFLMLSNETGQSVWIWRGPGEGQARRPGGEEKGLGKAK